MKCFLYQNMNIVNKVEGFHIPCPLTWTKTREGHDPSSLIRLPISQIFLPTLHILEKTYLIDITEWLVKGVTSYTYNFTFIKVSAVNQNSFCLSFLRDNLCHSLVKVPWTEMNTYENSRVTKYLMSTSP